MHTSTSCKMFYGILFSEGILFSGKAAGTATVDPVCTYKFESSWELPQDGPNLYLIHMLLTILDVIECHEIHRLTDG